MKILYNILLAVTSLVSLSCGISISRDVRMNIPAQSKMNVIQLNLPYGEAEAVYGINAGIINVAQATYGVEVGVVNLNSKMRGLQVGLGNVQFPSGFKYSMQIGLLNINSGYQIALLNSKGMIQLGLLNADGKYQIGIINSEGKYQLGLINICGNGWFMILLNFCSDKEEPSLFAK
ncbi:LA_2272/LA_2273 family lipoprotein [Leptospira wolffii]|uniref:LA_2272/LA_2273 family lipoprotein n=1 Tax=Leptospira wolffii TaxID=409998 RepID=A0ABV5BU14_9LEPT